MSVCCVASVLCLSVVFEDIGFTTMTYDNQSFGGRGWKTLDWDAFGMRDGFCFGKPIGTSNFIKLISRITSATRNIPMQMIRIFIQHVTTAGINIAGRNHKTEPTCEVKIAPNMDTWRQTVRMTRHGFACGKNPDSCKHNSNHNVKFCTSCKSDTHYMGQACCPNYPRVIFT